MKGSDPTRPATDSRALLVCLSALVGREPSGLLEVRRRHGDGMKRRVYRVGDELGAAATAIGELGSRTAVFAGAVVAMTVDSDDSAGPELQLPRV